MKTKSISEHYMSPEVIVVEFHTEGVLAASLESWDEVDLSGM